MLAALALPPDLTDAERALVAAFRRPAEERAALAIRVQREHKRLVRERGMSYDGALDEIAAAPWFTYSRETARRIVKRNGAWSG